MPMNFKNDSGANSYCETQARHTWNWKVPESPHCATVLIVDDNADCRMILRGALEREGFWCIEAIDGIEALKIFPKQVIDCILTDFDMPNMNGCEFLEALSMKTMGFPPAVMMTGNLSDVVLKRALGSGVLAVISKPFEVKDLVGIVRKVVDGRMGSLMKQDSISPQENGGEPWQRRL